LQTKERAILALNEFLRTHRHDGDTLEQWLRRTEVKWQQIEVMCPEVRSLEFPAEAREQVELEAKYCGYVVRQAEQVERFRRMESRPIPEHFDYAAVPQLRAEAKEKLGRVRPANLGQAGRISGICPADLAVLLMYLT
jgi:tRNA uridine 5-carboxymethylaminomethyl modification enzyme